MGMVVLVLAAAGAASGMRTGGGEGGGGGGGGGGITCLGPEPGREAQARARHGGDACGGWVYELRLLLLLLPLRVMGRRFDILGPSLSLLI